MLGRLTETQRGGLSINTRAISNAGAEVTVTSYWIEEQLESPPPTLDLFVGADRLLLFLGDLAVTHFARFTLDQAGLYPALGFYSERAMNDSMTALNRLGYTNDRLDRVTIEGWKRIKELRRHTQDSRQAFVAMWFDDSMNEIWKEGFKPGIERTEIFDPLRVDKVEHSDRIDDRIISEIRRSGLVVADFTGDRGGVYFEAGFALGLSIPVIWTCRKDWIQKVHFDTRQYNHIVWETGEDLREKLYYRILATVGVIT